MHTSRSFSSGLQHSVSSTESLPGSPTHSLSPGPSTPCRSPAPDHQTLGWDLMLCFDSFDRNLLCVQCVVTFFAFFRQQLPPEYIPVFQFFQFSCCTHPAEFSPWPELKTQHAALRQGEPSEVDQQHPSLTPSLQLLLVFYPASLSPALPLSTLRLCQDSSHLPWQNSVPSHHCPARCPAPQCGATSISTAEESSVGWEVVWRVSCR